MGKGYQNPANDDGSRAEASVYGGFTGHLSQGAPRCYDSEGLGGFAPKGSPENLTDKGKSATSGGVGDGESDAALSGIGASIRKRHEQSSLINGGASENGKSIDIPREGGKNSINVLAEN